MQNERKKTYTFLQNTYLEVLKSFSISNKAGKTYDTKYIFRKYQINIWDVQQDIFKITDLFRPQMWKSKKNILHETLVPSKDIHYPMHQEFTELQQQGQNTSGLKNNL